MSRCYPYPPPGYAGKCVSNEALIDSIKLQKEREEKAKSDRKKDKKREEKAKADKDKKREKKEKKEKEKANGLVGGEKRKLGDGIRDQTDKCKVKWPRVDESEQLERSSVTEEHGQPLDSRNISCSSDSTENSSSKRKRHASAPNSIQSHGSIIRIRLSSQKQDDPSTSSFSKLQEISLPSQKQQKDVASSSIMQPCSTSGRTVPAIPRTETIGSASASDGASHLNSHPENTTPSLPDKKSDKKHGKKHDEKHKEIRKTKSLYRTLIKKWAPSPIVQDLAYEDDDQEWLFSSNSRPTKKNKASDDLPGPGSSLPCSATAALQPRSRHLADADIYALPFTVPF